MASDNASITLPQNKPNEESPSVSAPIALADGQTEVAEKETASASTKDAISANSPSVISGDTVDNPVSPKTSIPPRRYNFDRSDEKEFHHYITKAHTCVRQGHLTTSTDSDKDMAKMAEMVSQMTHLLAAAGIGRDTTARALAYMVGPEKPEPRYALSEAKRDRRKKNNARRVPSGGSNKSSPKTAGASDTSTNKENAMNKDAPNTSESSVPSIVLGNAGNMMVKAPDAPNDEPKNNNDQATVPVKDQDQDMNTVDGASEQKKSFGRRRWWRRRNQGKGKENEGAQADSGNGSREETINEPNQGDEKAVEGSKDTSATTPITNAAAAAA